MCSDDALAVWTSDFTPAEHGTERLRLGFCFGIRFSKHRVV
jgi:hypothetical protein